MAEGQIKAILTEPVVIPTPRWEQIALRICAVLTVICLGVAVVGVVKAYSTATCVNSILGERAAPTATDARAHILFAAALDELLSATPGDARIEVAKFKHAVDVYTSTLQADQRIRNAHPLGRC
jgi:hypothetical protein